MDVIVCTDEIIKKSNDAAGLNVTLYKTKPNNTKIKSRDELTNQLTV